MTHVPARLLCSIGLCAVVSLPAAASSPTIMELDLQVNGDEVLAVVTLDHALGFPLDVLLSYDVNGTPIKAERVFADGPSTYVERLGPANRIYRVSAEIEGHALQLSTDRGFPVSEARSAVHLMPLPPGTRPALGERSLVVEQDVRFPVVVRRTRVAPRPLVVD